MDDTFSVEEEKVKYILRDKSRRIEEHEGEVVRDEKHVEKQTWHILSLELLDMLINFREVLHHQLLESA